MCYAGMVCMVCTVLLCRYAVSRKKEEIEASLLVWSDKPEDTVNRICELNSLGSYELIFQPTQNIHDFYFDIDEKSESKFGAGWALRLRIINDKKQLITLKGHSFLTEEGSSKRFESEADYHNPDQMRRMVHDLEQVKNNSKIMDDTKNKIIEKLEQLIGDSKSCQEQIKQQENNVATSPELEVCDPMVALKKRRLDVIQQRRTKREVRDVTFSYGYTRRLIAELDIDSVDYLFDDTKSVRLYNIEIEAKRSSDSDLIHSLTVQLLNKYPNEIKVWSHSKLATGNALEELLALYKGQTDIVVDSKHNNILTTIGFAKVCNLVQRTLQ